MALNTGFLKSKPVLIAIRFCALLVVIALSVFIFAIRDQVRQLAVYGYPGIFLLAFLAYATVLLPAPGVAIVFTMGSVFNPVGVALAAGAGAALGELSGYLAGFSGQATVENRAIYQRFYRWMEKYGPFAVVFLSLIPNPFFDAAGIVAGILKMPIRRFLISCWLGETGKMFLFAFAGSTSTRWLFPQ
jgi:membrane protein YqaA with SNARE-associated domain